MLRHKREETPKRCESAVARCDSGSPLLLDVLQKGQHLNIREVVQTKSGHRLVSPLRDESQEQTPGIAIGQHCSVRGVALFHQPLMKEGMQQLRQRGEIVFRHYFPWMTCRTSDSAARKRWLAC